MQLLRQVWFILDLNHIDLQIEYIRSEDNTAADTLSRINPAEETRLSAMALDLIQRRWGPHSVDRFASPESAQLPRYNCAYPAPTSSGLNAFAQSWAGENNLAHPPIRLLGQLAQLLSESTCAATVVAPYWPAQSWFQHLYSIASDVLVLPSRESLEPHPDLPSIGRRALYTAPIVCFRVDAGSRA